jgi:hypothetical protein
MVCVSWSHLLTVLDARHHCSRRWMTSRSEWGNAGRIFNSIITGCAPVEGQQNEWYVAYLIQPTHHYGWAPTPLGVCTVQSLLPVIWEYSSHNRRLEEALSLGVMYLIFFIKYYWHDQKDEVGKTYGMHRTDFSFLLLLLLLLLLLAIRIKYIL